jgi:hypothetical protein
MEREMSGPGGDRLLDTQQARNVLGFGARAVLRHPLLVAFVFLSVLGAALVLVWGMPRSYMVVSTVRAAPNPVMAAMVNPRRLFAREPSLSAGGAAQATLSQENLLALIDENGLVEDWDATRAPLLRAKDAVREAVLGTLSHEEKRDALAGLLRKALWVRFGEGTADIGIVWSSPRMAARLVEGVKEKFLATRRNEEVAAVAEALAILERHAGEAQVRINDVVAQIDGRRAAKRKGARPSTVSSLQAEGRWRNMPDPELMRLRVQILARRKALEELEQRRNTRMAELSGKVTELKAVYADSHPTLAEAQQQLQSLRRGDGELESLRADEQSMLSRYVALGGKDTDLKDGALSGLWPRELEEQDAGMEMAYARLKLEKWQVERAVGGPVLAEVKQLP